MPQEKPQEKEYLEAATNAAEMIDSIVEKITRMESKKEALEDEHGITKLKKEISGLKKEMEALAYSTVQSAKKAAQGRLFDDAKDGE